MFQTDRKNLKSAMCSVVGCDSWRRSAPRFKLPEDPERRLQWVQFILEVNGQKLKESSWTDITICKEHFTTDCFVYLTTAVTVKLTLTLKPDAVPSLRFKAEPEEHEVKQEPEEEEEADFQYDEIEIKTCDSPSSCSEEYGLTSSAAQESPAPSDGSDDDYSQILKKVKNIDMIRKKASLLQIKGQFVVNEKRLLQLFSPKCPSCGSKIKMEKVVHGVLLALNQQCLECDYNNQWNSQLNGKVPAAKDQPLTEEVNSTRQTQQTMASDENDEESKPMEETEESGEESNMDSDSDWCPAGESLPDKKNHSESEEETEEEEEEDDCCLPSTHKQSELCTECGTFFNKHKPHTCEHKVKPFSCNICGTRCVTEVGLNKHSRIHDENHEYRCKYCQFTFKTKVDKNTHEQIHLTQEKPFKCPYCAETFAKDKQRRIHLDDHSTQTKCDICGIEFLRPNILRRHSLVHSGAKPFRCSVCQRGFSQAGHLKSHMRLHTGERPFKCQHCDKCFNHNVSLKSHVQRYHSCTSGHKKTSRKINKTVSYTSDAEENGDRRGTDSGLDNVEEEHDKEDEVQQMRKPKRYKRSTGRPIGRPKKQNAAGEIQGQPSNSETSKVKVRESQKTHWSDEDSEKEPTESDISFDSAEVEEDGEKVTSSKSRSRQRATTDSDSDFDPKERKKKRQDSGNSSGRGRAGKEQVMEET